MNSFGIIQLSSCILFILCGSLYAQLPSDSMQAAPFEIKQMQYFAGSMIVVPEGKRWEVSSLSFSTDFMPIKVTSVKFKDSLFGGDTIRMPSWISEAELHDADQQDIMYNIKIKEFPYSKKE